MESGSYLNNGLRVSVDWMSFTVTNPSYTVEAVASMLGFDLDRFTLLSTGRNGYKSVLKLNGFDICILYDGNDNMGIHVDVSGTSMLELISSFKDTLLKPCPFGTYYDISDDVCVLTLLLSKIYEIGQFSRMDLAIDDLGCNFFSTDDLVQRLNSRLCVSRFRAFEDRPHCTIAECVKIGHTVYLGSPKGEFLLRVYDKALEQKQKNGIDVGMPWVRWEMQLRKDRAQRAAEQLIAKNNLGAVCVGVLANSLRLIENDNNNKSRCSTNPLWQKFIDGVAPLSLYVSPPEKSILRTENWWDKQIDPAFAVLYLAHESDLTYFSSRITKGMNRLTKAHIDMLDRDCPGWRDFYEGVVSD